MKNCEKTNPKNPELFTPYLHYKEKRASAHPESPLFSVIPLGFEPRTLCLKGRCSTC
jgi:hypothetical protein